MGFSLYLWRKIFFFLPVMLLHTGYWHDELRKISQTVLTAQVKDSWERKKLEQLAFGCVKYDRDFSVLCLLRIYHLKPANERNSLRQHTFWSSFGCVLCFLHHSWAGAINWWSEVQIPTQQCLSEDHSKVIRAKTSYSTRDIWSERRIFSRIFFFILFIFPSLINEVIN